MIMREGKGGPCFCQGLKCGVFCEMLSVGLGFWGYELGQTIFKELSDGQSPTPQQRGFIGGFSALLVMTATMPAEVVLRRLQVCSLSACEFPQSDTRIQPKSGTSCQMNRQNRFYYVATQTCKIDFLQSVQKNKACIRLQIAL